MKVKVKLFAAAREAVGQREIVLDLAHGETAAGVLERLGSQFPLLGRMGGSFRVAVNHEYVESSRRLADGDELALIPPVSGGLDQFEITESPLALDALCRAVTMESSGAIASFLGVVRRHSRGRDVAYLDYEAYSEMAVAKMREIGDEIRRRWPVDAVAMVHRVGRLTVGEASIAICVGAPHRREALAACTYAIERVKATVPIWKKEVWSDGAEWVGMVAEEEAERRSGAGRQPPQA